MTDYCTSCLYEDYDGAEEPCINCVRDKYEKPTEYFPKRPTKPITNGDFIRSMTDEELAETIVHTYGNGYVCPPNHTHIFCTLDNGCGKCWLSWLKSPVEVEE